MSAGTVYLVGAGPGDPGLITVRGRDLLSRADVVVYDRLVHPAALQAVRSDAEQIYVGKASARHSMKQSEINALLIERAQQGKTVVRLKGGDPFVFGRGGEEAEACRAAGVVFEIVPGVTSAIAAPAYAGIPVTHRDAASSFAVITGHERDDASESGARAAGAAEQRRNWEQIAHAADTLIFLMGVEALPEIVTRLQQHGRAPETPVALVQWGTWPQQQVVTGVLATIVQEVESAGLKPPAVCIVGDVVTLRDRLRWFDDPIAHPLFAKKVVVTRAREQASALSDLLRNRGAVPIEFPVLRIAPLDDYSALDSALSQLDRYHWMVLTSVSTVSVLADRLERLALDARAFGGVKIAAIGPATAGAIRQQLGLRADFVPSEAVAEAAAAEWPERDMQGMRVLLPRAKEARELLPEHLRALGAEVDVLAAYETVFDVTSTDEFRAQLLEEALDVITFTASSTVHNFVRAVGDGDTAQLRSIVDNTVLAAIGPITADTLREYGLEPHIVAAEHTIPGLVAAIDAYYRNKDAISRETRHA